MEIADYDTIRMEWEINWHGTGRMVQVRVTDSARKLIEASGVDVSAASDVPHLARMIDAALGKLYPVPEERVAAIMMFADEVRDVN